MPLASQVELPERYRIVRHIAAGGMASVWQAEDQLLGRLVAVKVLAAQFAADAGARARFAREARTAAQVSDHPHVVTIYDVGEHAGSSYLVMEHFAGGTVATRLKGEDPIDRATALGWLREAASGLEVAHAAGIVHRDVKPANLLLDANDRLAVGDFGIARLADDTQMTLTGQVLGTAAYLSPEQALGRPATAASDRYALAVVAHELLTGSRPFVGGPPTVQARQHVEDPPRRASQVAPDLPAAIDEVLERGMAKDPADRPDSAEAFVADLARALDDVDTEVASTRVAPVAVAAPRSERAAAPPPPAARTASEPVTPPAGVPPVRRAPGEGRPPSRRGPRRYVPAVAAALAALLVVGVIALAGGGDDESSGGGPQSAPERRASSDAASRRESQRAKESKPAPATEPDPAAGGQAEPGQEPSPASDARSPSELDAEGFALIKQGRYAEAVPILQRAVQGFREAGDTRSQGYAFALFNLGTALNRSGRPGEAIPLFQERLSFSNDRRGVVEQELRDAQSKLQGGGGDQPEEEAQGDGAQQQKPKKQNDGASGKRTGDGDDYDYG